jgi:hypothetical protein
MQFVVQLPYFAFLCESWRPLCQKKVAAKERKVFAKSRKAKCISTTFEPVS